jgi:hypothetical protein
MDKRDVLVSDIRVTAIGEEGQYIFDWIDRDEGRVEFLESESDYDDFDKEVERALNQNGVYLSEESEGEPDSTDEPKTVTKTNNQTDSNAFEPVGGTSKESVNNSNQVTSKSNDGESLGSESSNKSGNETHSFIVRMSDASERREVINQIESANARDEMELTGPFKVTYEVSDVGINLVEVEDLGIGSNVSDS